ncbi:MAG: amidase [Pseudomonadota bacterium]
MSEPTDPFARLDATAQGELVRRGEATPLELVDAAIVRIERLNPEINAVISTRFEEARAEARAMQAPPSSAALFPGVPYLIKDLSALAGAPLTYGSRFFAKSKARKSEPLVARAIEAGFIPLGKTNTPEFGLLGSTESVLHGPVHNPWRLDHSSGGSSGGAAAAVASGMVPIASGGDGGGSIRIPASCCGVFGLKPSRGRALDPRAQGPGGLSVALGLSRSVRDTAGLLAVLERTDKDAPFERLGKVTGPSPRRLRIALAPRSINGDEPAPEVADALAAASKLCSELGHTVEEAAPQVDGEEAVKRFLVCWSAVPAMLRRNLWLLRLKEWNWAAVENSFEPWTLGLAEWYQELAAREPDLVERSIAYFDRIAEAYDAFFTSYDVILSPVTRSPPVPIGEQAPTVDFETLLERSVDFVSYTPVHNAIGTPAMSVPLAWSADGLPIGLQFAAQRGAERTLLELAYELEAARPWADQWPKSSYIHI